MIISPPSSLKICRVNDCISTKIHGRGLCSRHYQRLLVYGDGPELYSLPDRALELCNIPDCKNTANHGRGMCKKHYSRWKRHGNSDKLFLTDEAMMRDGHNRSIAKNKGKIIRPETLEKLRRAQLGKKASAATRKKLSECHKGSKSYSWRGGITKIHQTIRRSLETRLWREGVFARDNYTCQLCPQRGGFLNAHHIKSFATYPALRFEVSNGMTLCKNCHKWVHNRHNYC